MRERRSLGSSLDFRWVSTSAVSRAALKHLTDLRFCHVQSDASSAPSIPPDLRWGSISAAARATLTRPPPRNKKHRPDSAFAALSSALTRPLLKPPTSAPWRRPQPQRPAGTCAIPCARRKHVCPICFFLSFGAGGRPHSTKSQISAASLSAPNAPLQLDRGYVSLALPLSSLAPPPPPPCPGASSLGVHHSPWHMLTVPPRRWSLSA